MATGSGLDLQVGYVVEASYGTGATVTRFLPAVSESIKKDIDPVESAGIYAGAQVLRSVQWAQGNATVGGDIQHEFYTQSSALLFRLAMGTVTTVTAGGTSVHTMWPVVPSLSASVQVGVPTVYGSVIPKTMTGGMIASWELAADQGSYVTWGATWVGQELTQGTALASASYSTSMTPWRFQDCSLKIDGTLVPVTSFKISGDNGLADSRRFLGGTTISQPLREKLAEFTGEYEAEWGNASSGSGTLMGTLNYDRFTNGTESALVFTMVSGTLQGTITANVRYNGDTPTADGPGIVPHKVPFKCIASGTLDANAITVVLRNNDSTA
jgi:hypothetical protein